MKAQRKALVVRSVLFLCGLILVCGPSVKAQTEESTRTWAATSIRGVSTESPAAEWWDSFHDEELTRLIRRGVANNLDLRLAAARVAPALTVEPIEVGRWLKALKKKHRLENSTLVGVRKVMNLVYKHGQRYGLLPRSEEGNPISLCPPIVQE